MNQMLGYIVLGLSLSAPIGPVNAAQLSKGIRGGFMSAWLVGLGAMAADVIYMLLVFFGVIHFLNIPFMQTFLWLFGGFLLIYTGIESLKDAGKFQMADMRGREPLLKSFMSGFFMSLGNPLSILFWLGIYGSVLAQTAAQSGLGDLILNSFSIILGLLIWDLTMAGFASIFRKYVSDRLLKGVSVLSGLFLIGFGLYFLFEALQLLLQRI
ncbi:LysE family transporter [Paenibacillus apis]|uniref:Amino acid transporter n=1 Tax=Paenibacillus apis TaxID=1792174 RepID=A0A920CN12_9BACL|nr:LysE family transporter [Paenibacillus apis]GIO43284.1 amino acid transporter [Paenibacillus apis]